MRRLAIPPTDRDYEIYEQFTAFKEENRLIDFDSILLLTYTALLSPKSKDYAMTGYRWIQVQTVCRIPCWHERRDGPGYAFYRTPARPAKAPSRFAARRFYAGVRISVYSAKNR